MTTNEDATWSMGEQEPITVVGFGTMGRGIARAFAAAGYRVIACDRDDVSVAAGLDRLHADLDRAVGRGRMTSGEAGAILGRIDTSTSLSVVAGAARLVIEAVPEDLELKRAVFRELDAAASPATILATNTSALSIASIASVTSDPGRVLGLHFFNPVHRMELVELVVGIGTTRATVDAAVAWCRAIGKATVEVADRAGFATSRINALIGNEAFQMLLEGVASADDIDTAVRLALHHPMGPFELVDLVGLDTRLAVLRRLHEVLGERFRPSPLLVELVDAGRLGRKVGHGVFRYDEDGSRIP